MPIERNPAGHRPRIARTAYVHATAVLIGNIVVGKNAFIGPLAVLRADESAGHGPVAPIIIGSRVNVQDGVIIHALGGTSVRVGSGTSLAHGALIHGPAAIGRNCFIGFRSMVFRATVGEGSVVLHDCHIENARLRRLSQVPSRTTILSPRDLVYAGRASKALRAFASGISRTNIRHARHYLKRGDGR